MKTENVPKNVIKVLAYVVSQDIKRAFKDPEIQKEYREWLESRKQLSQKAS